jgi:hypothetical protein
VKETLSSACPLIGAYNVAHQPKPNLKEGLPSTLWVKGQVHELTDFGHTNGCWSSQFTDVVFAPIGSNYKWIMAGEGKVTGLIYTMTRPHSGCLGGSFRVSC